MRIPEDRSYGRKQKKTKGLDEVATRIRYTHTDHHHLLELMALRIK